MVQRKKKTILDKVIELTKQLYDVAKFSPEIRECLIVAVEEIIGNKQLSQHCMALGITKKDYINYLMTKL